MKVCAFTSVCQEDYGWIDQYLAEAQRHDIQFVVHFDRCTNELKRRMANHWLCVAHTERDDPVIEFTEQHKQVALDAVRKNGFKWALAWDIDETWEAAPERLDPCVDQYQVRWLNLWGDRDHVRVDGQFAILWRVKLLNMKHQWVFDHPITNGPKAMLYPADAQFRTEKLDLVCLHHGLMTSKMRRFHKERWDRIYSAAVCSNPYGMWNTCIETEAQAVTVKHGYF